MSALEWSAALALELPVMDETHREFVDLLAAVEAAPDDEALAAWSALVAHTDDHFAREDQWMRDTRFASSNCHTTQHAVVLKVMRDGEEAGRAGRIDVIRVMCRELAGWFPQHAQSMDAALALHLRRVGYDLQAGIVTQPERLPVEEIQGCGGHTCDTAA